jgi:hemerythrin-like domain-containing protein
MPSEDPPIDRLDPFAQLLRSHRRLEEACAALEEAVARRDMETAMDVAAFFARQGRRHEEDEELSLFPRLRENRDLDAALARLEAEHAEHAELVARLEATLAGRGEGDLWESLRTIGGALVASYRAHIDREEREVFPQAQRILGAESRASMHAEMQSRRR